MEIKKGTAAIVLAAGFGKRMNSKIQKQYMELEGKPVLYYCLDTFEKSFIEQIILVVSKGQEDYCKEQIVDRYGFKKITHIVAGGEERYHSVQNGIKALANCEILFIHDGARPFVELNTLNTAYDAACTHDACVVGVLAKDTVKIADEEGFLDYTPPRNLVWNIQTPQVFSFPLIREAYERLIQKEQEEKAQGKNLETVGIKITDDAMVIETFWKKRIKLIEGNYENFKITTSEDLLLAEKILESRREKPCEYQGFERK